MISRLISYLHVSSEEESVRWKSLVFSPNKSLVFAATNNGRALFCRRKHFVFQKYLHSTSHLHLMTRLNKQAPAGSTTYIPLCSYYNHPQSLIEIIPFCHHNKSLYICIFVYTEPFLLMEAFGLFQDDCSFIYSAHQWLNIMAAMWSRHSFHQDKCVLWCCLP